MATYKCARELESHILRDRDCIVFSDVGEFRVQHNTVGWYLIGEHAANDAIFKYLYGTKKSPYDCIKELGDYPTQEGGIFPYIKTVENLTEIVGKLFLRVEKKRCEGFDFIGYVPKGSIKYLCKENIYKLCKNQVNQGNIFDLHIFEDNCEANRQNWGMDWCKSSEGNLYWQYLFDAMSITEESEIQSNPLKEDIKITLNPLVALSVKRTHKPKLKTL